MQLFFLNLVVWLAWLSGIALAQFEFSGVVSGSVNFPGQEIVSLGNLAVFVTSILRERLDLEMAARDVLATNRGPKLKKINETGLTTLQEGIYNDAAVIILSWEQPFNPSITQFMTYVHHSHGVHTILLKCLPLRSAIISGVVKKEPFLICDVDCGCIVLWTEKKEITDMLSVMMPGTLKQLPDSLYLLPCSNCLNHGSNQGRNANSSSVVAVCKILDYLNKHPRERSCVCIPLRVAGDDDWTKLLIRFMRSKEKIAREVRVMASDAVQKYIEGSGQSSSSVTQDYYKSFWIPRIVEVLLNLLLTGWLRVDGFSSALVARRAVRDYIVDSKETGLAANAFLHEPWVTYKQNGVCQVLSFRGSIINVRNVAYVVGSVNLICSLGWAVLIALEGGAASQWYGVHFKPPSKPGVVVILIGIGIAFCMDLVTLVALYLDPLISKQDINFKRARKIFMVLGAMVLEIGCIAFLSLWVNKGFAEKWIYSILQALVWIKWGIGSYLLGDRDDRVEYDRVSRQLVEIRQTGSSSRKRGNYMIESFFKRPLPIYVSMISRHGRFVYSSSFMH